MIHPLISAAYEIDKAAGDISSPNEGPFVTCGNAQRLTERVLKMFPELANNVEVIMQGPTDLCFGQAVAAMSVDLRVRYSLELAQDNRALMGIKAAEEHMVNVLATEIGIELMVERARLQAQGKTLCPYQLIIPTKEIDPGTIQPVIRFKTRYGVYDPKNVRRMEIEAAANAQ